MDLNLAYLRTTNGPLELCIQRTKNDPLEVYEIRDSQASNMQIKLAHYLWSKLDERH